MVGLLGIPLDYVTRRNMQVGWTASNEQDPLKYQAVHIGSAWEATYTDINYCCLDGKDRSWTKEFDAQKDGQ